MTEPNFRAPLHPAGQRHRFASLDALRGAAVLWMTAFHFCFDLNQFGYLKTNFYADPVWLVQRTCILSLFLLCAGMGQAIAVQAGQTWRQFGRRWAQIAVCAGLVSAGSAIMFPQSWIYFGVLHGMAVMLVVCRLTASWGRWLWLLGCVPIALGWGAEAMHAGMPALSVFDTKALNWLGLVSHKPITEDFVPLLPWLGVMWWGMALGQLALARGWLKASPAPKVTPTLRHSGRIARAALPFIGRWSLTWYMLHQPILLGALTAIAAVSR